jgi:predicted phosphodiesterase
MNETKDGILYFNPGTPTDRRFSHTLSIGMLETGEKGIKGRIINL